MISLLTRRAAASKAIRWLRASRFAAHMRRSSAGRCFVTCSGRRDGVGAQIHAILSTMMCAQAEGLTYVHTPLASVAHAPDGEDDWAARWERFFNLGAGELSIAAVESLVADRVVLDNILDLRTRAQTLYVVPHCHPYADAFPDRYALVTDRCIARYHVAAKHDRPPRSDPRRVNVAVHVRRGDVGESVQAFRYTCNEFIARIVGGVQAAIAAHGAQPSVALYSQGRASAFDAIAEMGVDLCIDGSAFDTFHKLAMADVLIMAKSSFSYAAALLSRGVKVYEPFWHPPLKEWIAVDSRGRFDMDAFRSRLTATHFDETNRSIGLRR